MEKLDLKKAMEVAQAIEHEELNAKELQKQFATNVHKVDLKARDRQVKAKLSPKKTNERVKECYKCGFTNHTADKCKYKDYTYNESHKRGHLAKACRAKEADHVDGC